MIITIIGYFYFVDRSNPVVAYVVNSLPAPISSAVGALVPTPPPEPTVIPAENILEFDNPRANIDITTVVQIVAQIENDNKLINGWSGSGSVISKDGLILTNAHVVLSTRGAKVKQLLIGRTVSQDQPPRFEYYAKVLQADRNLDIAIIQISENINHEPIIPSTLNLPYVGLGNSDSLTLGDSTLIYGYPTIGGQTLSVTQGIISGFTSQAPLGSKAYIKTNTLISAGSSGGMSVDRYGKLVAIPTQYGYGGPSSLPAGCLPDNGDLREVCLPSGINALRPINLAKPLIEKAMAGEINVGLDDSDVMRSFSVKTQNIISDSFASPNTGWYRGISENGVTDYINGAYIFQAIPAYGHYSVTKQPSLKDSVVSVDAESLQNPTTGGFGLICRASNNSYYGFEVSQDGYYAIWKRVDGHTYFLTYWNDSPLLPVNGKKIRMTLSCKGDEITAAVDGNVLTSLQDIDSNIMEGENGLFVNTYEKGNITVSFDNYEVGQPK